MFKAIGKLFRAFIYLITGRIDEYRKEVSTNPHAIRANYDNIIEEKKKRIQQYKDAVATLIAQEEKKVATLKILTADVDKLERLKEGAAAKAKAVVAKLQGEGKSMDEIKHDEEYVRCLGAFKDFSSTLTEKHQRIDELENDLKQYQGTIADHKVQLESLLREVEKLKAEAADAVADVISAGEEEEIANVIAGISNDTTNQELEELRDMRQKVKAKARISKELAGTDTKRSENEFLEYAAKDAAADEFDALIGLAKEADAPATAAPEKTEKTTLPES